MNPWLCYFARHNDVYVDGRILTESPVPAPFPFSVLPDLEKVDFVVCRDRIVDLRAPSVTCLTFVDDATAEDRTDGRDRYWLGPPADLRFLALKNVSANLTIRLAPAPEITTFPIEYFLADAQGHVSQGELWGKNVDVRRLDFPLGFSTLRLSVKTKKESDSTAAILAGPCGTGWNRAQRYKIESGWVVGSPKSYSFSSSSSYPSSLSAA